MLLPCYVRTTFRLQPMFALNQRLPCVRGAGAERLRGWRDVFRVVRCSVLRTANPSVIFLRKCHLPLHKGGLKGECAAVLFCSYPLHAAGCKHTPLRSVASLLRKHSPRPTVYNDMQCADIMFVLAVCFIRAIRESPVMLFALSLGFAQTNAPSQTSVGVGAFDDPRKH